MCAINRIRSIFLSVAIELFQYASNSFDFPACDQIYKRIRRISRRVRGFNSPLASFGLGDGVRACTTASAEPAES